MIDSISSDFTPDFQGYNYQMITVDKQIFAIVLNIIWAEPERWKMFIPRLGGMHFLMIFVGCIGVLMEGSGLKL